MEVYSILIFIIINADLATACVGYHDTISLCKCVYTDIIFSSHFIVELVQGFLVIVKLLKVCI